MLLQKLHNDIMQPHVGGTKEHLGQTVIVFFEALFREWEQRAMLSQELANMTFHGVDVWCHMLSSVNTNKIIHPLPAVHP